MLTACGLVACAVPSRRNIRPTSSAAVAAKQPIVHRWSPI